MAGTNVLGTGPSLSSRFQIDLTDEAHRFFRQRIRVAGIGVLLGLVFIAVGIVEVGALVSRGPSASYAIALLLIVLGAAVTYVSLNSGLINPVTKIRGNASGITFERRWGRPRTWSWSNPILRLDLDDRRIDPAADAAEKRWLFFEGPGGIYGNLPPASLGPLLDTARTFGAVVSEKQLEQRDRRGIRLVRRIRVRPAHRTLEALSAASA